MLDSDLARLYGVPTRRLNEQVKRNSARFPEDFLFQLSVSEKEQVVANCDHLRTLKQIGFHVRENPTPYKTRPRVRSRKA